MKIRSQIKDVFRLRMQGKSIYEISEVVKITPQRVDSIIKKLPLRPREFWDIKKLDVSEEVGIQLCLHRYWGYSPEEIAIMFPEYDAYQLERYFEYLASRTYSDKGRVLSNCYSDSLSNWMREKKYSVSRLARELGEPRYRIVEIMEGRRKMPPSIMEKVETLTNLTEQELSVQRKWE